MKKPGPALSYKRDLQDSLQNEAGAGFLFRVSIQLSSAREMRDKFFEMALTLLNSPEKKGLYVILNSRLTDERINEEVTDFRRLFLDSVLKRIWVLSIEYDSEGITRKNLRSFSENTDPDIERLIPTLSKKLCLVSKETQIDYNFFVKKLFILKCLTHPEFISRDWLKKMLGCSHTAIDRSVDSMGSLIERNKSRKMRLKYVPDELLMDLVVRGLKARSTARFRYKFGGDAPKQEWLNRLKEAKIPEVMIGGIAGTHAHYPEVDITGTPRIDLSVRLLRGSLDYSFLDDVAPGLKQIHDPFEPADLVIHTVRHLDPFKNASLKEGYADEVECLLDLFELNLKTQGYQFKDFLGNQAAQGFKKSLETRGDVFRQIINKTEQDS